MRLVSGSMPEAEAVAGRVPPSYSAFLSWANFSSKECPAVTAP
jgi:hypothetical protein